MFAKKLNKNKSFSSQSPTIHKQLGLFRTPTADVGYVPNAKYLAHITHQTPFDPIYQMYHISYFLQHATVESQICHGTECMWHMIYSFFYSSFSLISPSVSPGKPQSSPLSLSPQSSPLKPQPSLLFHVHANADANDHFHPNTDADANLSLAMVFLFSFSFFFSFFFGCGLMGSVLTEVGGFEWARLWVGDVSVGVMSVWVCCVGWR